MSIARALPENAGELTAIAHAAKSYWGYPKNWIARWEEALKVTPEYINTQATYVVRLDDRIAGFCSVLMRGREARIDHMWVLPSEMGKGVGRTLFRLAEDAAREAGATRLRIESDPGAEGFYVRMGAIRYGKLSAPMDGTERFLPLLEKSL